MFQGFNFVLSTHSIKSTALNKDQKWMVNFSILLAKYLGCRIYENKLFQKIEVVKKTQLKKTNNLPILTFETKKIMKIRMIRIIQMIFDIGN